MSYVWNWCECEQMYRPHGACRCEPSRAVPILVHPSATAGEQKKQTKTSSLIESLTNVIAGIGVAILAQIVVFPFFGIRISLAETSLIAVIFTGISLVRSYALRRVFEWLRVSGRLV